MPCDIDRAYSCPNLDRLIITTGAQLSIAHSESPHIARMALERALAFACLPVADGDDARIAPGEDRAAAHQNRTYPAADLNGTLALPPSRHGAIK